MRNIALAIGVMVIGGCGGGSGNSPPDINADQDNLCDVVAGVACYNMYLCCSEGEIEDFLGVDEPRTVDQCRDDFTRICERNLAELDWSISEGRAAFDADVMNGCLELLVAPDGVCASVETALPWAEACMGSAWTGLVADGDTCYYNFECQSVDSYCAGNRTCTALPGENDPCNGQCA